MKTSNLSSMKSRKYTDKEFINGLKKGNPDVTNAFFYGLCEYTLNDIRYSIFRNTLDYDDMVGELYVYLSANSWAKLDTFEGINGCKLKSWMVTLAWRYFLQNQDRLMGKPTIDIVVDKPAPGSNLLDAEALIDIELTLSRIKNERYAQVIRLMVIEGYTAEEVAKIFNTTVQNVYNIKHRAINQFISLFDR